VEGVEFVDAPLGGGVQVGLHDREVDQSLQGAPGAAGGALLDLDGPDGSFGFVVGEGLSGQSKIGSASGPDNPS
jgi:hypothetical protein